MQTTDEQIALLDSLKSDIHQDYYGEENEEEDMQVPKMMAESEPEEASIFSILSGSSFSNSGSPPKNLHAVPPIISRPAPVTSFSTSSSSFSAPPAAPSLASSVVFPPGPKASKVSSQLSEDLKSKGVSTRSVTKKSSTQVPEVLRSSRASSIQPPSIQASSIQAPSKPAYFAVPPSFVSPAEFTEKKRAKDFSAGSSFIPLFMGNMISSAAHLTQTSAPGGSQQVRHATTVAPLAATISLYDRYADKESEVEKSKKKTLSPLQGPTRRRTSAADVGDMTDLLQTLDFQEKEKEDNGIPPKPSMPSHLHVKKGPEGLLATPSSPPVQTAMRFSKQEVLGMIERLLKRV